MVTKQSAILVFAVGLVTLSLALVLWRGERSGREMPVQSLADASPPAAEYVARNSTGHQGSALLVAPSESPREQTTPPDVPTLPVKPVADSAADSLPRYPWHSESPRVRTSPEVFEKRHAHRTPDEIIAMAAQSWEKHVELVEPAFKKRVEQGLFVAVSRDGGSVRLGAKDPLVRMDDDGSPGHVNLVWLPFEEYPEIYDSDDEHFWLQTKAKQLKAQAKGAAAEVLK